MVVLNEGNNIRNVGLIPIEAPIANLYGTVTDADSGQPIQGVRVTLATLETYTGSDGSYAFEGLEPGSYPLTFEKDGYETVTY